MTFISMFIRCPRTNKVFNDPVMTPAGICYERQAIEPYTTDVLYPATFLQNYIQELLTNNIIDYVIFLRLESWFLLTFPC